MLRNLTKHQTSLLLRKWKLEMCVPYIFYLFEYFVILNITSNIILVYKCLSPSFLNLPPSLPSSLPPSLPLSLSLPLYLPPSLSLPLYLPLSLSTSLPLSLFTGKIICICHIWKSLHFYNDISCVVI